MSILPSSRKGARKISEIPADVMLQLNRGQLETANLIEWLAVDYRQLIPHIFTELQLESLISPCLAAIQSLKTVTTLQALKSSSAALYQLTDATPEFPALCDKLATHPADTVRCLACYLVGFNEHLTLAQKLQAIQPFAADKHFGVREIAWMATRPAISQHLETALIYLTAWVQDADENIRRFASESTRPRGVWCQAIGKLQQQPALGLPLLNPLKADPAAYVQNSVANWLNDASKTQPDFVIKTCAEWLQQSDHPATNKIVTHALRTLKKKNMV